MYIYLVRGPCSCTFKELWISLFKYYQTQMESVLICLKL